MADLKAQLEKYIDQEANRRANEIVAKMLSELGITVPKRRGPGRPKKATVEASPKKRGAKRGRVVSEETKAKMRAAWAARKGTKTAIPSA